MPSGVEKATVNHRMEGIWDIHHSDYATLRDTDRESGVSCLSYHLGQNGAMNCLEGSLPDVFHGDMIAPTMLKIRCCCVLPVTFNLV